MKFKCENVVNKPQKIRKKIVIISFIYIVSFH